jgi:hypothetical protein
MNQYTLIKINFTTPRTKFYGDDEQEGEGVPGEAKIERYLKTVHRLHAEEAESHRADSEAAIHYLL